MRQPLLLDEQIRRNKRRSAMLVVYVVVILTLVVGAASFLLGMPIWLGLLMGAFGALLYALMASSFSVPAILKAAQARPANPADRRHKLLLHRVEELAIGAGLPMPRVYVTPSKDINAFATGRNPNEAVIAVTEGALDLLNQEELEGVLAHELSHIRNYDIRMATITIALVAIVAIVAEIVFRIMFFGGLRQADSKEGAVVAIVLIVLAVLFLILAPLLSRLAYLSMSRQREYLADASGAHLTRNPEGLARGLERILDDPIDDPKGSRTVAALYLANPFKRQRRESPWATHPPLLKRIARLRGIDVAALERHRLAKAKTPR